MTQCQNILKINEERGTLFNHHAVHKALRAATELEICNKRCIWDYKGFFCSSWVYFHYYVKKYSYCNSALLGEWKPELVWIIQFWSNMFAQILSECPMNLLIGFCTKNMKRHMKKTNTLWLLAWLTDWLIDQWTDWLADWLTDWVNEWSNDGRQTDRRKDTLTGWWFGKGIDILTYR